MPDTSIPDWAADAEQVPDWAGGKPAPFDPSSVLPEHPSQIAKPPAITPITAESTYEAANGVSDQTPFERFKAGVTAPAVPIPKLTINPDDSKTAAVGKEAVNLALGIPEFLESPVGALTAPLGALSGTAGRVAQGAFGANMLKSVGEGIVDAHKNWDKYTPAQKAAAVTDAVGSGLMAALLGRSALKKPPISPLQGPEATGRVMTIPQGAKPPVMPSVDVGSDPDAIAPTKEQVTLPPSVTPEPPQQEETPQNQPAKAIPVAGDVSEKQGGISDKPLIAPDGMTGEDFELKPQLTAPYRSVAMLQGDKVIEGKPGDNHASIAERLGFPPNLVPGFVTKDGKFAYQYEEDAPKPSEPVKPSVVSQPSPTTSDVAPSGVAGTPTPLRKPENMTPQERDEALSLLNDSIRNRQNSGQPVPQAWLDRRGALTDKSPKGDQIYSNSDVPYHPFNSEQPLLPIKVSRDQQSLASLDDRQKQAQQQYEQAVKEWHSSTGMNKQIARGKMDDIKAAQKELSRLQRVVGESVRTPQPSAGESTQNLGSPVGAKQEGKQVENAPIQGKPTGTLPKKQQVTPLRQAAQEFDALVREHAATQKWVPAHRLDDLHSVDPGKENLGSVGIRGAVARNQAMAVARRNAAKQLGLDPDKIGEQSYRATHIQKLRDLVGQEKAFTDATKDEGDESGKIGVEAFDLKPGDHITVGGEDVKVVSTHADHIVLEDGRKFGKQQVPGGKTLYVEGYEPKTETPTAMKFRMIDQERQQRGLPPLAKPEGTTDQAVMDKAMAAIDRDPQLPYKLVKELNTKPRTIEDWENHVLMLHKIDLRDAYAKSARDAAQAFDDSKQFPERLQDMLRANIETDRISDELEELEKASNVSGSARGRALRSLQVMANEDYSLAGLEQQARAAKGGAPITAEERAELQKIADEYAKKNADLTQRLAGTQQRLSEMEAAKRLDDIQRATKPTYPEIILKTAERFVATLDQRADASRKALAAMGLKFNSGIDPAMVAKNIGHFANIGAAHIGHIGLDLAKWTDAMVKDLGEGVHEHLPKIWEASKARVEALGETAPKPIKDKVKRIITKADAPTKRETIKAKIKGKLDAGKKDGITNLVAQLARSFVEQGVRGRDALIDAVHGVLLEIDPAITRRDTMDAISGYGDFKQLSKDQVSKALRDLKRQMQEVAKLEDMQAGEPPRKTGVERAEVTKEQSRLIKLVNDAKRQFQVPISDPGTQLKSSLDTLKSRMQTQLEEYQRKIKENDFAPKERRPIQLDSTAQRLKAELENVRKKFKAKLRDWRRANLPKTERAFDWISNVRRFAVLSGVNVLGKLAAYTPTRIATMAASELTGKAFSKVPGLRNVFEKAPSEGISDLGILSRSIAKGFTKGIEDSYKTIRTGSSEIKSAYSPRLEEGWQWYNIPQQIHEVIKSPLRRTAFENSFAKRIESNKRSNPDFDPTDPFTQLAIAKDAYMDSDRALLLEQNRVANGIRQMFKRWEDPSKSTGRPTLTGKALATVGRIEFPILTVPLNYMKQTLENAFGLITGTVKYRAAVKAGLENLKPEEADAIARHFKYGAIGAGMLLWGFFDGYNNGSNGTFGGFYQPGEKRKPDQAGVAGARVFGHNIPGLFLHNPMISVAQFGHTIGAIAASKIKKTGEKRGLTAGLVAGAMGLLNQSPIGSTTELVSQLSGPSSEDYALGTHIKGLLIPQLIQEAADYQDRDAQGNPIKRDAHGIPQYLESGLPYLREQLPVKVEKRGNQAGGQTNALSAIYHR